jgi:hypothetical protein
MNSKNKTLGIAGIGLATGLVIFNLLSHTNAAVLDQEEDKQIMKTLKCELVISHNGREAKEMTVEANQRFDIRYRMFATDKKGKRINVTKRFDDNQPAAVRLATGCRGYLTAYTVGMPEADEVEYEYKYDSKSDSMFVPRTMPGKPAAKKPYRVYRNRVMIEETNRTMKMNDCRVYWK